MTEIARRAQQWLQVWATVNREFGGLLASGCDDRTQRAAFVRDIPAQQRTFEHAVVDVHVDLTGHFVARLVGPAATFVLVDTLACVDAAVLAGVGFRDRLSDRQAEAVVAVDLALVVVG